MTHTHRHWLFWLLAGVWLILTGRMLRNQWIIRRNDREIKRLNKRMKDRR